MILFSLLSRLMICIFIGSIGIKIILKDIKYYFIADIELEKNKYIFKEQSLINFGFLVIFLSIKYIKVDNFKNILLTFLYYFFGIITFYLHNKFTKLNKEYLIF